MTQNTKA